VKQNEENTFGDGFAGDDFGAGLVGAGYSPLSQDALDVDMICGTWYCVNGV
jgi:hypothetical protein